MKNLLISLVVVTLGIIFFFSTVKAEEENALLLDIKDINVDSKYAILEIFYRNEKKSITMAFYHEDYNRGVLNIEEGNKKLSLIKAKINETVLPQYREQGWTEDYDYLIFADTGKGELYYEPSRINLVLINNLIARLKTILSEKKMSLEDKKFLLKFSLDDLLQSSKEENSQPTANPVPEIDQPFKKGEKITLFLAYHFYDHPENFSQDEKGAIIKITSIKESKKPGSEVLVFDECRVSNKKYSFGYNGPVVVTFPLGDGNHRNILIDFSNRPPQTLECRGELKDKTILQFTIVEVFPTEKVITYTY